VSVALAHPNRHPVPALVVHVSRRCSRHCGMCVDLPGAALQEAVPERQPDHVARRRDVSGFVRVSVALAHPNRHPVPAFVVHVSRRCSRHCGMCADLPGAALQEAVPELQPDDVARRRDVSGFVRVSVALAHPNRHPVPAFVVHVSRRCSRHCGMCADLPGAASQGFVPDLPCAASQVS
jgi:hypothetical protein